MNIERKYHRSGRFPVYNLIVDGVDLGQIRRKFVKGRDGLAGRRQPTYDVWAIHGVECETQVHAEELLIKRAELVQRATEWTRK